MSVNQEISARAHETHMTGEAWAAFIAAELKSTCKAYIEKPAFLLGHSRTEKQTTADYAGRELLELVQNAADAASEVGGSGRVPMATAAAETMADRPTASPHEGQFSVKNRLSSD